MIHELVDEMQIDGIGSHSAGNSSAEEDVYDKRDCLLSNESLQSFIMDSPFSFRNPIFFSVTVNNMGSK